MRVRNFTTQTRHWEEKYHYQIMASSKGKAKNQPKKRKIREPISRPDIRSRVRSTRRKRANTPHRRQPYGSVSIPQLVYELLTIDKYNQGIATDVIT